MVARFEELSAVIVCLRCVGASAAKARLRSGPTAEAARTLLLQRGLRRLRRSHKQQLSLCFAEPSSLGS